jgi:hypothetical protein
MKIGLDIMGPEDATRMLLNKEEESIEIEEQPIVEPQYSQLAGHIQNTFEQNRQARQNSGMEDEIFESIRANNGEYNPEDLQRIKQEGGSTIYMNLSSTKIRAAQSWIKDILLPSTEDSVFSISPTPVPTLPEDLESQLEEAFKNEFTKAKQEIQGQQQGQPLSPKQAQDTLMQLNKQKRDIKEAVIDEINLEGLFQMKQMERKIKDDLAEGYWREALNEFIEDFCIFPTAFMKGPVIQKKETLVWENGAPIVRPSYTFINKRVNPMDVYPEPSATSIQEGNFCEHIRFSASEIYDMKGLPGYFPDAIDKVLETGPTLSYLNTNVEYEKAEEEKRGNTFEANKNVYHGIHYWGSAKTPELEELGLIPKDVEDPNKCWEIEAISINNEIIRCKLNTDPLKRRPYYKASYQNIPGSFWGRSLPNLMRDIQRMCNACARALANNMGLASGPQMEVVIDRLADSGDIEEMVPLKIWQTTSDPTGSQGRAIQFFQVPSIANELLAVYDRFEQKADDATGIPRYSYGNEKVGGAAQTAQGLSMLMESATKSIKDAIRHIDEGLIRPRVEYQFYWHLIKNPELKYTGDVHVITHASDTLTLKGAQQAKRQEFLQITANPMDQELMGREGRAELLREMAKDLNLTTHIVPSRLELKKQEEEAKQMQERMVQQEQQKQGDGMAMVERQAQSAEKIAAARLEADAKKHQDKMQVEIGRLQNDQQRTATKAMSDAEKTQAQKDIARTRASVDIVKNA